MALTPLPPAPSILDPENFSEEADAFVAALETLVTELNAIIGLTIPAGSAAASTLTGGTLAANVLASSLTSLGTIASLVATVISGGVVATQAQQETGTATNVVVTPGRQKFHPSAAKCFVQANAAGSIQVSHNVASVTDVGTGQLLVTATTPFSTSSFPPGGTPCADAALSITVSSAGSPRTTTTFTLNCWNDSGALTDPTFYFGWAFGDQ